MSATASINKAQVSEIPSEQTNNVISTVQQDSKAAVPQQTTRAINSAGIKILSGGNVLGTPLLPSIIDAYTNLVSYHYIATFFIVVSSLYFLGRLHSATIDIFDSFHTSVSITHNGSLGVRRSITTLALFISRQLINYKLLVATFMAFYGPYLAKPSTRNGYFAGFLSVLSLITTMQPLQIILISQFFFLAISLRDPQHKAIIIIIALVTVLIGQEILTFDNSSSLPFSTPQHSPTRPSRSPTTTTEKGGGN